MPQRWISCPSHSVLANAFFARREALLERVRAWALQARAEAKKRPAGPATQALRAAIAAVPGQRERVTNCNLVQV